MVSPKAAPGAEAGDFISIQAFPALLELPEGSEVSKVSCGSRHTAAVTRKYRGLGLVSKEGGGEVLIV